MPITVMAVTTEEYEAWLAGGGTDFASLMDGSIAGDIELASAED
jgi:cytochrome c oxidase subunit 2